MATLLALAACAGSLTAPAASASTASLNAALAPDRPGASAALTLALRFAGGPEGVPAPLRTISLQLPAGLRAVLPASSCAPSRLRRSGAAGCPPGALIGRGSARLEVHAGSQTIPEQSAIWVFRGPSRSGGGTSIEMLGVGNTPLEERTVSTGVLRRDDAPFGSRLTIAVPPIPTVALEPNASFDSLSLRVGARASSPTGGAAPARIVLPRSCPTGGFPFAAAIGFADGSRASARATVRCP